MTDRRELILERVFTLLEEVSGWHHYRGRGDLQNVSRPALVLLDADEVASPLPGVKTRPGAPQIVTMRPEVHVVLENSGTQKEEVGSKLNEMRLLLLRKIMRDPQIWELLTENGNVQYLGLDSDQGYGREMSGKMNLQLAFTYPLILGEM